MTAAKMQDFVDGYNFKVNNPDCVKPTFIRGSMKDKGYEAARRVVLRAQLEDKPTPRLELINIENAGDAERVEQENDLWFTEQFKLRRQQHA
jgi:hypothetical protein